ncbi:hypothetical protein [Microbacterium sp. nov. GSS16]|uniref:hypothetical protein n=1 Tax=Microbacterium sp. nov. GSS16 TaxID=3019890 RepID=UPI0023052899|nr:hypothetical protein [Microbacterium sp. nov. GSS16]WCD92914.1 hypothetical protein PGB26_01145 [Microbacterium sp. nov. GSS16]
MSVAIAVGAVAVACVPVRHESEPSVPTDSAAPQGATRALDLPRVPWEGGSAYWTQFPDAVDWTAPSFFPIVIWFNGVTDDSEVRWDKAHGINTYAGMWEGTDFALFPRNDVYWIGERLNDTFNADSPHWPGVFLDDEVDGRYSPAEGLALLRGLQREHGGADKFTWANFTQLVIGEDLDVPVQEQYVSTPDVISVDMYWYTIPFCDWQPYRGETYIDPVPQESCRTASSYGRVLGGLAVRDEADGQPRPRWGVVENLNGFSGAEHVRYITPDELKGAAMNSIINEARGLLWFNQSFSGDCESSGVVRQAQIEGDSFCGAKQVEAMGEVNRLIQDLAPVINTQSYVWDFGEGLDTMLKVDDGHAYVFAMTDGGNGRRSLTLPDGIRGTRADVVGEDRRLEVRDGVLADDFSAESSFHIYRIPL